MLDRAQARRRRLSFVAGVVKKFTDDRAGDLAALVAYYSFFSIFPLILAAVTVLGFVLDGRPELSADLVDSALAQLPVIGNEITEPGSLTGSPLALVIGVGGALFAGMGAMYAAQTAMNRIWYVPRRDWPNPLKRRLRAMGALGVIGLGSIGTAVVANIATRLEGLAALGRVALLGGSWIVNVGVFVLAFQVLTSRRLRWRELVPGATLASTLWFALQFLGTWVYNAALRDEAATYGTFGTVIGLLSFFFLLAQLTILSAELNVVKAWRLWPRSLTGLTPTEADERVLEMHVEAVLPKGVSVEQLSSGWSRRPR